MSFLLVGSLAAALLFGCDPPAPRGDGVGDILRQNHGLPPAWLTEAILAGDIRVREIDLDDVGELHIPFSFSSISAFEGLTHYGAASVSDYVQCLLEEKAVTSTRRILEEVRPDLAVKIPEADCGICCAEMEPLPEDVGRALRDYWSARLKDEASGPAVEPSPSAQSTSSAPASAAAAHPPDPSSQEGQETPASSLSAPSAIGQLIREHQGVAPGWLSEAILKGKMEVRRTDVEDEAALPIYFRLVAVRPGEYETLYLAGSVSQYSQCLLELRAGVGTAKLIGELRPELRGQLPKVGCGVCCGGAVSLPVEVLAVLKEYWLQRLPQ